MANNWTESPLSDLCSYINRGSAPSYIESGGALVLNQKCVRDQRVSFSEARRTDSDRKSVSVERFLQPWDILVNSTGVGTLGRVAQVRSLPEKATIDSHVTVVRPNPEVVNPQYLGLALRHLEEQIEALGEGSTGQTELSKARLAAFVVPVAPDHEQPRIANILGTLDERIELNLRMNSTLGAMARALFKDWFIDYGPVHAKIEGRAPYLPQKIWDLFPDQFDNEDMPQGWSHTPFGLLLEGTIGGDWGKDAPDSDHTQAVCIIRGTDIPNLVDGLIGRVPTRYVKPKKANSRLLQDGDIVIEVSGGSPTQPTGRSLLVTNALLARFPNPVICASFCRRFRPLSFKHGLLTSQHLSYLYSIGGTWEYQNQSTGIANFQTPHFLEAEKVVWPGSEVVDAFTEMVEPIIRRTAANETLHLISLRSALLPKLMTGEVRLSIAPASSEK